MLKREKKDNIKNSINFNKVSIACSIKFKLLSKNYKNTLQALFSLTVQICPKFF